MNKEEALDVLLAHTCCCIKDVDSCDMCPWDYTHKCDEVEFTDDLLIEATKALREDLRIENN